MKNRKILPMIVAVFMIIASLSSVAVSAHSFTASATNTETRYYRDGVYVGSEFSWGGNDHPSFHIYEDGTISSGMYHDGYIPKVNVETRGPYGEISSEVISTTITYYDATYHGWIDCSYHTTYLGEYGENNQE